HQATHYSPTRRSSDLHEQVSPRVVRVSAPSDAAPAQRACLSLAQARIEERKHERVSLRAALASALDERVDHVGVADRSAFRPFRDRKSTRLNSSHQLI